MKLRENQGVTLVALNESFKKERRKFRKSRSMFAFVKP